MNQNGESGQPTPVPGITLTGFDVQVHPNPKGGKILVAIAKNAAMAFQIPLSDEVAKTVGSRLIMDTPATMAVPKDIKL